MEAQQTSPCIRQKPTMREFTAPRRRSPSSAMNGPLPPSSRMTFLMMGDLAEASSSRLPTSSEPVKEIMRTSGWVISASPVTPPAPVTMFTTPAGSPASSRISPSSTGVIGASEEGLATTVLPVAMAGQMQRVARCRGKFHGVTQATTP